MSVMIAGQWDRLRTRPLRGLGWARRLLGLDRPSRPPERVFLEDVVLPHYGARGNIQRILFVGMNRSTRHYWRYFRGKEYWSIDFDARNRKYAGRLHITDSVEHLEGYFRTGHFDLIVCNDVQTRGRIVHEAYENAVLGCWSRLRPGGELVVGTSESESIASFPLHALIRRAGFVHNPFPPLASFRHRTGDHVYEFYKRAMGTLSVSPSRSQV